VQPVLGFRKYHALRTVDDLGSDFLAPVGRQAMHEQRVGFSGSHGFGVDLKILKHGFALFLLFFLTHASPDVGHHQIGLLSGLLGRIEKRHPMPGGIDDALLRAVIDRAGDVQLKVELAGGIDIRMAHIIAVADPGHGFAGDVAAKFKIGLHIRQ